MDQSGHIRFLKERKSQVFIISVLYLIVSIYLYNKYGVRIVTDSSRYLDYASQLSIVGLYFDPLNFWYVSYVFFVYFSQLIGESGWIIIFNQYVFGLVAVYALYDGINRLTGKARVGFLGALIFILFPDNLMWHSYVLTESFYCSMLCIAFYVIVRFHQSEKSVVDYLITSLILLITFFSKPTSPALFIAMFTPFALRFLIERSYRIWKIAGLFLASLILLILANGIIQSHQVLLIYTKGDIIFAMHKFPNHKDYELMTIDVPQDLFVPEKNLPIMIQMGQFVTNNFIYFLKLFTAKILMYVTHIRPFWSIEHNLAILVFTWLTYFFSIRAIRMRLISFDFTIIASTYFLIHSILIGITWADWDGRFFVPIVPLLVVLGSIGISGKALTPKAQA
ncbi:MAG: glycosyltransferase family 39 protein [Ekhidna sp.]|nr:glycosyltransferase family 39 protein [Ekhidna sp.]